jgi:adenylate cyclase
MISHKAALDAWAALREKAEAAHFAENLARNFWDEKRIAHFDARQTMFEARKEHKSAKKALLKAAAESKAAWELSDSAIPKRDFHAN